MCIIASERRHREAADKNRPSLQFNSVAALGTVQRLLEVAAFRYRDDAARSRSVGHGALYVNPREFRRSIEGAAALRVVNREA